MTEHRVFPVSTLFLALLCFAFWYSLDNQIVSQGVMIFSIPLIPSSLIFLQEQIHGKIQHSERRACRSAILPLFRYGVTPQLSSALVYPHSSIIKPRDLGRRDY